jgi:hypothetical protein
VCYFFDLYPAKYSRKVLNDFSGSAGISVFANAAAILLESYSVNVSSLLECENGKK